MCASAQAPYRVFADNEQRSIPLDLPGNPDGRRIAIPNAGQSQVWPEQFVDGADSATAAAGFPAIPPAFPLRALDGMSYK